MAEIKKINVGGVDYDIVSKELTKTTYAELKALRDNGQLSEGHLYRITDYVTTTTQTNTKSAGNVFDVIVLATSTNELSHIARAIQHEGDTYFDGNDLGAWELWYDLDNDTDKYAWADATNGKGVIYRMIDEKRNDCPYDFKNILFYNNQFTYSTTSDKFYYTFSYIVSGKLYDGTVEKQITYCYGNSMGTHLSSRIKSLPLNVFRNDSFSSHCYSNTFGYSCYSNTFGNECTSNTFGDKCSHNTLGNICHYNTFGDRCSSNTLGNICYSNTFGNECYSNTFGDRCKRRHLDYEKNSITLSDEYYDDGSGQLVPIKHPDLSTQPSILPYKFMGQYVYEQLIPIVDYFVTGPSKNEAHFSKSQLMYDKPVFLESSVVFAQKRSDGCLMTPCEIYEQETPFAMGTCDFHAKTNVNIGDYKGIISFIRVVYTSMPEEGGYYGYNNYGGQ